jgi:hypothetical protein
LVGKQVANRKLNKLKSCRPGKKGINLDVKPFKSCSVQTKSSRTRMNSTYFLRSKQEEIILFFNNCPRRKCFNIWLVVQQVLRVKFTNLRQLQSKQKVFQRFKATCLVQLFSKTTKISKRLSWNQTIICFLKRTRWNLLSQQTHRDNKQTLRKWIKNYWVLRDTSHTKITLIACCNLSPPKNSSRPLLIDNDWGIQKQ